MLKFSVGDQITLTCKTGLYGLEQSVTMVCALRNNGSWDRHLPDECYKLCPHINTTTLNTEILQHDNTPGGSVLYACSPGYRHVSGYLIQRCLKDGSWSGTPPLCEAIVECPVPDVPNAVIIMLNSSLGGVVSVSCVDDRRHRHIGGDLRRTCMKTGVWTGTPPVCKECKCPCSFVGAVPIKSNETENLEQRIRELRSLLSVQKNMTTKARRQKVCASDPRPSAKMLGIVFCVGVITIVISAIAYMDLSSFIFII